MVQCFCLCKMHQVVRSHNSNRAGSDDEPLEDIRIKLLPITAATIQTLDCITKQGLVLMKGDR